jgi:Flp pilus assembly protein TadD
MVLHCLTACVIFLLAKELWLRGRSRVKVENIGDSAVAAVARESCLGFRAGIAGPLLLACLWAVHPLTVTSVSYIIQRAESLAALWIVLSLLGVAKSLAGGETADRWRALAIICSFLGATSKETASIIPLAAVLLDRSVFSVSWTEVFRRNRFLYSALALATWPVMAMLVISGGGRGGTAGFGQIHWFDYLLAQGWAIPTYLTRVFFPGGCIFDYGTWLPSDLLLIVPSALLTGFLIVAAVLLWHRRPSIGFPALLFFILLAPSSSVIPVVTQPISEHRMYLPLACVLALLTAAARHLPLPRRYHMAALLVAVLVVACLVFKTRARNALMTDPCRLWEQTALRTPQNSRAWNNWGTMQIGNEDFAAAAQTLAIAMEIEPDSPNPMVNLSAAWNKLGRFRDAELLAKQALLLTPIPPKAYANLGAALNGQKRPAEALVWLDKGVAQAPDLFSIWQERGLALLWLGHFPESVASSQQALTCNFVNDNSRSRIYVNIGAALFQQQKFAAARIAFTQALVFDPDCIEAQENLKILAVEMRSPQD